MVVRSKFSASAVRARKLLLDLFHAKLAQDVPMSPQEQEFLVRRSQRIPARRLCHTHTHTSSQGCLFALRKAAADCVPSRRLEELLLLVERQSVSVLYREAGDVRGR